MKTFGTWIQGTVNGYEYDLKRYPVGSEYGIGGSGRISKMSIFKDGKEMYSYDRLLDYDRLDASGRVAYEDLIKRYN